MTHQHIIGIAVLAAALRCFPGQAQESKIELASAVAWDQLELSATVRLNLASAALKLPTGRSQAEELCISEFPSLILPRIFGLALDSSKTIGDAVASGEIRLSDLQALTQTAPRSAAVLSSDLSELGITYRLDLMKIIALLIRHRQAASMRPPLSPRATRGFTGIIIYADDSLPIHGTKQWAMVEACLFPKIWDSEMNLVYERNMVEPELARMQGIARYAVADDARTWRDLVGDDPLRILATAVFGVAPTDPIIARDDALKILSSDANRQLLREGRVVIILSAASLSLP